MPVSTRSHDSYEISTPETIEQEDAMTKVKEPTMAEVLAEMKKGNNETQAQLKSIKTSIKTNQKVVEDYIKLNDEVVQGLQGRVLKLEGTVTTLEATVSTMSDEIQSLKKQTQAQKKVTDFKKLKSRRRMKEDDLTLSLKD